MTHTCYILLAALDPTSKFEYFQKYWGEELLDEVKKTIQAIVCSISGLMLFGCLDASSLLNDTNPSIGTHLLV